MIKQSVRKRNPPIDDLHTHRLVQVTKNETNKTNWAAIVYPRRKCAKTGVRTVYVWQSDSWRIRRTRRCCVYAWKRNELSWVSSGRVIRKWENKHWGKKNGTTCAGFSREQLDSPKSACLCEEKGHTKSKGRSLMPRIWSDALAILERPRAMNQ